MNKIAVVAHSKKQLGAGLMELRDMLAAEGISDPLWYEVPKSKHAPKAALKAKDAGAELVLVWGGDGTVQRCIDALAGSGVGAVVLYSLFEEEVHREQLRDLMVSEAHEGVFGEALSYFPSVPTTQTGGGTRYLRLLEQSARAVDVPGGQGVARRRRTCGIPSTAITPNRWVARVTAT